MNTCSRETPMPAGAPGRWQHAEAREVPDSQQDGWPGGDTVTYRCEVCGHEWTEELPQ